MSKISKIIDKLSEDNMFTPNKSQLYSDFVKCLPFDENTVKINEKVLNTEKRLQELADKLANKLNICKTDAVKILEETDDPLKAMNDKMIQKYVNHPSHYQTKSGLEAIDVIEVFGLNFNLGNACKYILRAGKKDAIVQELEKAKWYIEREIANRKAVQ